MATHFFGTSYMHNFTVDKMVSETQTIPVFFNTQTPYPLPPQKFMIPASWKRYQLSQLVNKALSLLQPIPFDFLVRGELLRGSLAEWCNERGAAAVSALYRSE